MTAVVSNHLALDLPVDDLTDVVDRQFAGPHDRRTGEVVAEASI